MGGCFLALLKFIGPLAQCNFPKFAIEEDCVSKIFADSIRKVVTGGCIAADMWIGLLLGSKKIQLCTSSKDPNKRLRISES
ncbi:hypothetical protein AMTRI_Chr11g156250 [Amborella trichopoda]